MYNITKYYYIIYGGVNMKMCKKILLMMLAVVMTLSTDCGPTLASSVAGKTETNAIELQTGKKKSGKFWTGTAASVYYVVALPEQGKLSVAFSAESLGTSATIELKRPEITNWSQTKKISYDKKKKITQGTMSAEYVLPKGSYVIRVTPGKEISKTKKFTITAKFTATNYEDVELNNNEDCAQKLNVYNAKFHKMYLTTGNPVEEQDLVDCFMITLKDVETVKISLSSKATMDNVRVLVREKTDVGYNTIQAYDVVNSKLSKSIKLKKGTYYIKVWCTEDSIQRQMPYSIKCSVK